MTAFAAAQALFAALNEERWDEAAALADPDWLLEWWSNHFARLCDGFTAREEARKLGQPFRGFGSDLILRPEAMARFADERLAAYPDDPTLRELASMPPVELLAMILRLNRHGLVTENDSVIPLQYRALRSKAKGADAIVQYVKEPLDPAARSKENDFISELHARLVDGGWRFNLRPFHLWGPDVFFPEDHRW